MSEQQGLEAIKAKMSSQQRQEMAELIGNELKRREQVKMQSKSKVANSTISSGLGAEQVQEMYGDVNDKVRQLRLKKLERELAEAKRLKRRMQGSTRPPLSDLISRIQIPGGRNLLIFGGIVLLGAAKIMMESGMVDAETVKTKVVEAVEAPVVVPQPVRTSSVSEREILSQLDSRRVALENRRGMLENREAELKRQMNMMSEKLAELRSLTSRLGERRVEQDQRYEARMEQLASVYGSMAPAEAAPLIGKLDDDIALALLKRFPGKRMGQVLSAMSSERAIELTLLLTDRKALE